MKEFKQAQEESNKSDGNYKVFIPDSSLEKLYLQFTVKSGVYKDQIHILEMKFRWSHDKQMYPINPPLVTFKTPIWHCNISRGGAICLDILRDQPNDPSSQWSRLYGIDAIFTSIILLLESPNTKSPLNCDAAHDLLELSQDKYAKKCSEFYGTGHCQESSYFKD
jgi:ubiquitin-protein ligase